jgi:mevalonate kinase
MNQLIRSFQSKILLFGEYGLMHNAMALSIPFQAFEGKVCFPDTEGHSEVSKKSNRQLKIYAAHLRRMVEEGELNFIFDIDAFEADIARGMYFDSSIPQGFGVGSSGALVAALYDRYALEKIPNDDSVTSTERLKLKESLAQMESFFHGKSSGTDPLICYLSKPMLIQSKTQIDPVGLPEDKSSGKGAIFLINTGKPGKTQPLVNLFLEKCQEEGFLHVVKQEMIPFSDNCIKAFLKGEAQELFTNLKELSNVLLQWLSPMIPRKFRKLWRKGIETEAYYLKLCGSGGGGYILGFTEDLEKARLALGDQEIEVIRRF